MLFARPDFFTRWTLLAVLMLTLLLAACGVDSDTVETVDDAVKLIQDVDRDGTWGYLSDGLDALAEQPNYAAQITVRDGTTTISVAILSDIEGNARFEYTRGTATDVYVVPGLRDDREESKTAPVYRVSDGAYVCADAATTQRFNQGEHSLFEYFGIPMMAERTLSVAELDDDSSLLERDADHYILESRLPDALDLLDRTDNADLRARIANDTQADLTGTFDLDDETGALLHFAGVYTDDMQLKTVEFTFDVRQWTDESGLPIVQLAADLPGCD